MASYTVVVVPLRSSINSLDALRFFLWIKKLQELERERDSLWMGLQSLEQARAWLCCKLEENKQPWGLSPAAAWTQLQGVNRTLHSVTYDPLFPAQTALKFCSDSSDMQSKTPTSLPVADGKIWLARKRSLRSRGTPTFQKIVQKTL